MTGDTTVADTERRLNEALRAARETAERLDRALTASGLGLWDWNIETGGLYVDRQFTVIMGYPPETVIQRVDWMLERVHPEDRPALLQAFRSNLKGLTPHCECDFRGRTHAGEWRWLHLRAQVTERRADGWALRMTGTNKDIDESRRIQERLERATSRVQLLLDATDEGIIGLDEVGSCTFVNPAALRILDCRPKDVLGHDFSELVRHIRENGEELLGHDSPIHRCLTEGRRYRSGGDELFTRGDRCFPVELAVSPIHTQGQEQAQGAVLVFQEVTEKRTLQHQLQFQALHDPLTGLLNRRGFEAKLTELLDSARRDRRQHALCFLDMDQFKVVNDTCGHIAGDELLRQIPDVLRRQVRDSDVLARLGGDEFALLLENCTLEDAERIATAVRDDVRGFRFVWQHRSFAVGVSIGVVGINAESQGPVSVLGAADTACYIAKEQGPGHVHVSHPHDLAVIRRRGEMRWVARLRRAVEDDQFQLFYQSIAALDHLEQEPLRHEILLRMEDGTGGVILPGVFVPAAERYHLMSVVDAWVVEHALRLLAAEIVPRPELHAHRFGINLSGESLRSRELLERIEQAIARHGVPPTMLYFEITETAAITNLGAAIAFMERLQALGCHMALDDFGSGMSSFSYLKHLPVDYLKIDGSFVRDIVRNRVDQSIVRAAHTVGEELGIATVAEHVETPETLKCLRDIGVAYGQGFAIARPAPLAAFVEGRPHRAEAG
jgi:diguanylate cyclase (GGDEF)-like protein/PAS domain S-box-containing protein